MKKDIEEIKIILAEMKQRIMYIEECEERQSQRQRQRQSKTLQGMERTEKEEQEEYGMTHDFSEVFDTDSPLWQRVLEIYEANEKYDKKIVSGRNLHHKFPRSFSKKLGEPIDNDKDNLISLSLADHFLVHYYYYKLAKKGYRQSMATAFTFMAKKSIKYMSPDTAEMIAKDYEEANEEAKQHSEEHRRKISESKKG